MSIRRRALGGERSLVKFMPCDRASLSLEFCLSGTRDRTLQPIAYAV
ncbi:MAG TPA: hypothetical protein V6D18_15745 [Thermosynechococcaceae cyanobacterium]